MAICRENDFFYGVYKCKKSKMPGSGADYLWSISKGDAFSIERFVFLLSPKRSA
jgi:hypothetical protein